MPKKNVKKPVKRKTKKKQPKSTKVLTYIAYTLAVIAILMTAGIVGYYIGNDNSKPQQEDKVYLEKKITQEKKTKKVVTPKKESVSKRLKEVLQEEKKKPKIYISASHEIDGKPETAIPKMLERKTNMHSHRPKLAIILDDVGTAGQVRAIKSLHLPLTMSFLPPSKARPNTPKLAAKEKFYMVHLPMEAMNWSAEEPKTLRITDTQSMVSARIKEIKTLFPNVRYINNHTGSKFTSSEVAMNRLIAALHDNHIQFIDSRTIASTKAPQVMKNFGLRYMARDVFLDHHMEKEYVKKQIKQAIKVAKSHGTAIAIGHPHKNTLKALYESKKLFKDIDLVLVSRLY